MIHFWSGLWDVPLKGFLEGPTISSDWIRVRYGIKGLTVVGVGCLLYSFIGMGYTIKIFCYEDAELIKSCTFGVVCGWDVILKS